MAQPTLQQALDLIEAGRIAEGVHMLRTVASSRDPAAMYLLARLTWSGNMVEQAPVRGRLLFEYAAALGHGPANVLVTNLLASGIAGRRDWPAALERLAVEGRQVVDRQDKASRLTVAVLEVHRAKKRPVGNAQPLLEFGRASRECRSAIEFAQRG